VSGNKWKEWEEGERRGEKVIEAQDEREKEKRATSEREGGRGCLIAVRQIGSK